MTFFFELFFFIILKKNIVLSCGFDCNCADSYFIIFIFLIVCFIDLFYQFYFLTLITIGFYMFQ